MKLKKFTSVLLAFCIAAGTISCGNINNEKDNSKKYTDTFIDAFDTSISITAYCKSDDEFTKLNNRLNELFTFYHKLFDIYNSYDSDGINNTKTINDNAAVAPVKVDKELIDLLLLSKEMYNQTDGNINIAFGAVLKEWHFAREAAGNGTLIKIPDMQLLKEKNLHTDINDIEIDSENLTVFLKDKEMSLDLGAIAKGFATELVADALTKEGFENFLISAGGNTKAVGTKPGGGEWTIAIQNPNKNQGSYAEVLLVSNMSVVTSGSYERFFEFGGKKYHHIINKDSLMPEDNFLSVSIITEDSALADALSTAVFNMSLEDGQKLIDSIDGTFAMWILNDNTKVYSEGFEKFIK